MRILMVNKFLYRRGGAESFTIELGEQLQKMGHEVEYFGMYDEKNTHFNKSGLYASPTDFHELKFDTISYPFKIIRSNDNFVKMKRLIDDFKPDIIHLNNFNYQLTPSIIDAAKEKNVPVVFTAHDSQFVCPNHLMYDFNSNSICTKCIRDGNMKHCAETECIHGSFAKSVLGTVEGTYYQKKDSYDYISRIVCPSKFMKKIYDSDSLFRFYEKTIYLQNYTNDISKKKVKREDYIFYFGRLSPEKGMNNIIKAAELLPNERFVCAGSGPSEADMKGVPNLELVGFKKGEDLHDLIRKAKLVILPSTCYENCPLAVIEAQKLGAAVLVPSYGGAAELTDSEFQIKDTSPEKLVNAIQKALEKGNLEMMRKDSAKRSKEYMLLPDFAEKMVNIYTEVIGEKANMGKNRRF